MTTAYKHETATGAAVGVQGHIGIRTPIDAVSTELEALNGYLQSAISSLNDFYQSLCGFPVDLPSQGPATQPQEQRSGALSAIDIQVKHLRHLVTDIGVVTEEITRA